MASPVRLVTLRLQKCHAEIDQRSDLVLPQCNVRFTLVTETVCHHVLWIILKAQLNHDVTFLWFLPYLHRVYGKQPDLSLTWKWHLCQRSGLGHPSLQNAPRYFWN